MTPGAWAAAALLPLVPAALIYGLLQMRQRSRARLRAARAPLQAALDACPEALLVIDGQGCIVGWNRPLLQLPGVQAEVLHEGCAARLLADLVAAGSCPADWRHADPGSLLRGPGRGDSEPLTLRVADWTDAEGTPGHVLAWRADPDAPDPLARALVEQLPLAVSAWGADGRCLLANRAYRDGGSGARPDASLIDAALAGRMQSVEHHQQRPDGSERHLWRLVVPHRVHGRVAGCFDVVTDLTPLKQTQRELQALRAERQAAAPARG